MDSTPTTATQTFRPAKRQEFLHLCALNSFAVVQPVLNSLAENVAFLRYYDYSPAAVSFSIALLTFGLPASLLFLRVVLHCAGVPRVADAIRAVLMVLLSLLTILYAARWAAARLWNSGYVFPESLELLPALAFSVWLARSYVRSDIVRQFLTVSAVGVLIFPTVFFLNPAVQEQVLRLPAREYFQPVTARSPAPVIFVVFDGLSGMALLNENHEIDGARYPSFARLADRSIYYRNASTVHTRTDHALPAILSGSYPTGSQSPVENEYPLNLFRLLDNTRQFTQTIFEPYTQMAPSHLQRRSQQKSTFAQTFELLETVLRVYERMCLPRALEPLAVDVPREWFRILPQTPADPKVLEGKIVYHWDTDQHLQVDHFLSTLRPSAQPALRFLHIALPHDPWTLFRSGRSYRRTKIGDDNIPGAGDGIWTQDEWLVNQGWQRYLLQVQYADQCLGKILDRLEESAQFEESMIIVTADHGFAFLAGSSRRDPEPGTLCDLIPVPLFIKYPKQRVGSISDRNAETIDILPTIAETIGTPKDAQWEGCSLLSEEPQHLRKTVIQTTREISNIVLESAFRERFRYVERLHSVFGKSSVNAVMDIQFVPELNNRKMSALQVGSDSNLSVQLREGMSPSAAKQQGLAPCYFAGRIGDPVTADNPAIIAVAVNGTVRATTRTSTDPKYGGLWSLLIPDDAYSGPDDQFEFFEVERTSDRFIFHKLKLE